MQRMLMGLRALFDRRGVESEMDKEMRLHLEMETEENVRRGMTRDAARRAALVAFGGVENAKESTRDERGTRLLETIVADIRFALRGMRAKPAFALTIIALVALGTGANTAVFSMLHRLVLRPLPFAEGDRMVSLTATAGGGKVLVTPSSDLTQAWIARARQVEQIRVSAWASMNLGDTANPIAKDLEGAALTPGFMQFVGLKPVLGRDILPSDTVAGAPRVAILGYRVWLKYFGKRDDVIGQSILLDGESHTVVGVAPSGFFVPYSGGQDIFTGHDPNFRWEAIAKLRPGATAADAQRELISIWRTLGDATGDPPRLQTTNDLVFASTKRLLTVLFGAVVMVLLIACANVANLLLSRAWGRQREFGVRAAMGASRGRLTAQLLTESLLYSIAGAAIGFLLAMALVKLLATMNAAGLQGIENVEMNGTVLAWTVGLCIVTGVFFGLAPVMLIGDGHIGDVLKASARSSSGSYAASRLRSSLVVVEVSLSVVLLVGTGMMVRTMVELSRADTGFRPQGLAGISLQMRGPAFADSTVRQAIVTSVMNSVRRAPGIRAATFAMGMPPHAATGMARLEIEDHPIPASDSVTTAQINAVEPDFFRIVGITVRAGRVFQANARPTSRYGTEEIMINERFARRYWPNGRAVGSRILYGGTPSTIVGIVNDVDLPGASPRSLAQPQIYMAIPGAPRGGTIIVSSPLAAPALDSVLRRAIREGNGLAKAGDFQEANAQFKMARLGRSFAVQLLGGFALLALVLAAVGLYAVMSYSVTQRTREIGIRIALGAQPRAVARLVLGEGTRLAVVGIVIGCAAAVLATQIMRPLLYKVSPGDPFATAATIGVLIVTALVACALPARRATRVDPVDLVRAE